jgi:PAS domain S-box-containing protein
MGKKPEAAEAQPTVDITSSEGWLHGLVDQTLAGIYLIQDGHFPYVNQGFADIFGYASPVDIIDKMKISQLIAPEDRQKVTDNVRRRTEDDVKDIRYTFVGLRKDGSRIHVEVHGRNMEFKGKPAVIGLILDITERKLAEAASDEKLRGLFELSPLGIALTDMQGHYIEFNEAFRRICGYPADELRTLDYWTLTPKRFEADEARQLKSLELTGRYGPYEKEYQRKDGSLVPIQLSGMLITGSDGGKYIWSIVEDITERKRLESEMAKRIEELNALNARLAEAQTQLLQAEKMAAVGQLAAGVAHEINNPVGFINSNLGSLKKYTTSFLQLVDAYRHVADVCPPEHPALLRVNQLCDEIDINFIRDDAFSLLSESSEGLQRIKHIVADLKDFSRVGETKWQLADVHKCLDSTLNVISSEITSKTSIVKEYGVLPEIMCMPFQLNQVFMNLLLNAAHAIKERGTIILRTGREAETVWIEMEDNGIGISAENLKRIFDPFFTTKAVGAGTGLGLSVAYGIVQQHQGRIEVRSEPGKGTVFRVILPINPLPVDDKPNVVSP